MSMMKYRVHEVAKDFNSTSKEISQILTDYASTPKNHMQVLPCFLRPASEAALQRVQAPLSPASAQR